MEEGLKRAIKRIFYTFGFLFITVFFILPYLVQISTYFHEIGHVKTLEKYGVKANYRMNLLDTIPNFIDPSVEKLGVTTFDLNEYKKLDSFKKTDVNVSGINSDLTILFLLCIYLSLGNIYIYYKEKYKGEVNSFWVLAINWILFMWVVVLVQITLSNINYPTGDIYQLARFIYP
ncbi:MAG: hypothetical protein ACP5OG_04885 [Candidatus Nanoarchaeia archaeon]